MLFFSQRALFALCFIFLFGCSTPTCRQWEMQDVITQTSCFTGGRLILEPDSNYSRLELEIARNRSGIRFYINLLFLEALPDKENPSRTSVEILFDDQDPWIIHPYLLVGGQRLLLPGDVADILIQALLDGKSFNLQIGRSCIRVIPDQFSVVYGRLLALPIEEDAVESASFISHTLAHKLISFLQ